MSTGTATNSNTTAVLRSAVDRVERLDEEIKGLNADKSDIFKELKAAGFDVKVVKKVIAARRKSEADRSEEDQLFDLYMSSLGSPAHAHEAGGR